MIDHVSLGTTDISRAIAFYDAVLGAMGWNRLMTFEHAAGYGPAQQPTFWIGTAGEAPFGAGTHVAFAAESRAAVDAFHAAGVACGGQDNGAPGLRPYHPSYYGAFVKDLDGHHIEAVCHRPE